MEKPENHSKWPAGYVRATVAVDRQIGTVLPDAGLAWCQLAELGGNRAIADRTRSTACSPGAPAEAYTPAIAAPLPANRFGYL